jgi:polyvinyl alcohol dehydrogenase (cytochrome)
LSADEPKTPKDAAASKVSRQKLLARLRPSVPDWRPIAKRAAGAIVAVAAVGYVLSGLTGYWWTYKTVVGELLGHKPAVTSQSKQCADKQAGFPQPLDGPRWNGWGADLNNSRFQRAEMARLTPDQVPGLQLKWAFGFPGASAANAQPAVVGGVLFVGGTDRKLHALDAKSGCTIWTYQAKAGVRTGIVIGPKRSGGSSGSRGSSGFAAYFGDVRGAAYGIDASTGEQLWMRVLEDHKSASITGTPTLYEGRLYVPVSSTEEGQGNNATYECCTFRGSVVALDSATGDQLWKSYTITEAPTQVGKNSAGTAQYAPAGAAVWNSPTIDRQKGMLYIGTGNSYTGPAVKTSDSVIAMDLKTGKIAWWNQVTGGDAFLVGCRPGLENCPKELGPDHDFGNAPILRTLPGGKRIIVIGQKSGTVWGLDPDAEGKVLWQFKAGKGGALGGIEWGSAADDSAAYIPVSDVLTPPNEAGGLFAQSGDFGIQLG